MLRAPPGQEGEDVSFHRFVVTYEITLVAAGAGSEAASPIDPDLELDLTKKIRQVRPKGKNNKEYTVESVKKVG